ncbi:MAG: DUF11 domain-containing protein [Clostridia bacterium]|nr:DUF11 domain-containing protein [Clostridia bacterium]
MAEVTNLANVSYSFTGARSPSDSDSNLLVTNVLSATSIEISKTPLGGTYIPGDNHSFVIRVENTGTVTVDNVVIQDNLGELVDGETTTTLMNYITGSGLYSLNGSEFLSVEPTNLDPITLSVGSLAPGDVYVFVYTANTISGTVATEITNTATVSGDANGTPVTASATATITEGTYALLSVQKFGSDSNVSVGEDFSYTLILTNTGNTTATNVVVTDSLPENFSLESVSYTDSTGTTTTLDAGDYSVSGNTLTVPSDTSTLDISVPAGENIIFTLSGRFTEA